MDIPTPCLTELVTLAARSNPDSTVVQYYQRRLSNPPKRHNPKNAQVKEWAEYMVKEYAGVSACARHFGVPRALVDYHISRNLERIAPELAARLTKRRV